ncbi:hypothetical protein GW17_00003770 [Ensete ventricosum]|nr:hypothetical protein GW17_00003770 [Ensete ventricosum]
MSTKSRPRSDLCPRIAIPPFFGEAFIKGLSRRRRKGSKRGKDFFGKTGGFGAFLYEQGRIASGSLHCRISSRNRRGRCLPNMTRADGTPLSNRYNRRCNDMTDELMFIGVRRKVN